MRAALRDPLLWLCVAAPVFALLYLYSRVPGLATGDGYGAYFPVVWDLQDGKGLRSFLALQWGIGRAPAYPLLLYAASLFTGDVATAVEVVAVLSVVAVVVAAWVLMVPAVASGAIGLGLVLWMTSESFYHAAFVSTPDLACVATTVVLAAVVGRAPPSSGAAIAAGLLAMFAVALRPNAVYLVPLVLAAAAGLGPVRGRKGTLLACLVAVAVPGLAWVAVSLIVKGAPLWLPGGPTEISSVVYHPDFAPGDAPLALAPLTFIGNALHRGLVSGPHEVATRASWLGPAVVSLGAVPLAFAASRRAALWFGALLLLGWLLIAPLHFEARYYLVQVLFISFGAAHFLHWLAKKISRRDVVAAGVCVLAATAVLVDRWDRAEAQADKMKSVGPWIEAVDQVAAVAAELPGGCIATEEVAFRLTPFRHMLRQRGLRGKVCCCGWDETHAGFLHFQKYGTFDPDDPPAYLERLETPGGPPQLVLFRRR